MQYYLDGQNFWHSEKRAIELLLKNCTEEKKNMLLFLVFRYF